MPYSPDRRKLFLAVGGTISGAFLGAACRNASQQPSLSKEERQRGMASATVTLNPALDSKRAEDPRFTAPSIPPQEPARIGADIPLEDSLSTTSDHTKAFIYSDAFAGVFLPRPDDGSKGGIIIRIAPNILFEFLSSRSHLIVPVTENNLPVGVIAYLYPVNRREVIVNLEIGVVHTDKVPRDRWESLPRDVDNIGNQQTLAARWKNWTIERVELNRQPMQRNRG